MSGTRRSGSKPRLGYDRQRFFVLFGLPGFFFPGWRLGPVLLEHRLDLLDHLLVGDDHPDFAPLVELEFAQALAANERTSAVADDRADVKAAARELLPAEIPLRFDL